MSLITRCTIALLVVAAAGVARAGETAAGPEAQADELMHQALDLRRQGDNGRALELLRQAEALAPSGRIMAQVGSAEFALQRWVDAEAHLQEALASHDSAWLASPKNREMLEKTLTETRHHIARLDVHGPAGAQISVDGKPVGTLPLAEPIHVAAGTLRLAASASGRQQFEKALTVSGGDETTVSVDLLPLPAPVPSPPSVALVAQPRSAAPAVPAWRRWTGGALFVAGLAAVGTGIAWVAIDGHTNCSPPAGGFCEQVYSTKTLGWISIGAGAVAAGAGATLFLWKGKEAAASVAITPGALTVHGRF